MSDFVSLNINSSFLLNAGIVGFMGFLDFCKAKEGSDFIIEEQALLVSKDFIRNPDIPNLYLDYAEYFFKSHIKFSSLFSEREDAENLIGNLDAASDNEKKLSGYFKKFSDMLQKNSFKSAFVALEGENPELKFDAALFDAFKKEKNLTVKYGYYCRLHEYISKKEVKRLLAFKDAMYSYIKLFFENVSFFLPANLAKPVNECFKKDFYDPLIASFESSKKAKKRCIECMEMVSDTDSMTFMIDTADDINRKKSLYWNCKPDAKICPTCKFIYSFVPFGFSYHGYDAMFINCNSSLSVLSRINKSYRDMLKDSDKRLSFNSRLYKQLSSEVIKVMSMKASNIQVIFRSSDALHYRMSLIDRNKLELLDHCSEYLKAVENRIVKDGERFIRVYDEIFEAVLAGRGLYSLLFYLLRKEISNDRSVGWLRNILQIEIKLELMKIRRNDMEDKKSFTEDARFFDKKYLWAVSKAGADMRQILGGDIVDNSLRSFVYRLLNAVSSADRLAFFESVVRIYSGKSMPVPQTMKDIFNCSEDAFAAIASNYILGLTSGSYNKEETKEI